MGTSARFQKSGLPSGSRKVSKQSVRKVAPPRRKAGLIERLRSQINISSRELVAFIPGTFFIAMAISLLLAPTLFTALVGGFFLFIGVVSIYGGWRLLQLVRKVQTMAKSIEARIYIHGMGVPDAEEGMDSNAQKKIIFH